MRRARTVNKLLSLKLVDSDLWGSAVQSTTSHGFVRERAVSFLSFLFPSFTALFLVFADDLVVCKPPRMNFLQSPARFIALRSFPGGF